MYKRQAEYVGEPVAREVSGFGDPKLRLAMNFFGAPALTLDEFANYRHDLIIGGSLQVSLPVGQYDRDKLVNIGTNRWYVKPELGISKGWGRWTLEGTAAVTFFGDNDDFFGGKHREQAPIYGFQGHLVYGFPSGIWGALTAALLVADEPRLMAFAATICSKTRASLPHWLSRSTGKIRSKFMQAPVSIPVREPISIR